MLIRIARDTSILSPEEGSNNKGKIIYLPDADERSWEFILEGLQQENSWSGSLTAHVSIARRPEFMERRKRRLAEYSIYYNKIKHVSFLIRGTVNESTVVAPVQISVKDILPLQDLLSLLQEIVEESIGSELKTPAL